MHGHSMLLCCRPDLCCGRAPVSRPCSLFHTPRHRASTRLPREWTPRMHQAALARVTSGFGGARVWKPLPRPEQPPTPITTRAATAAPWVTGLMRAYMLRSLPCSGHPYANCSRHGLALRPVLSAPSSHPCQVGMSDVQAPRACMLWPGRTRRREVRSWFARRPTGWRTRT